MALGKDRHASLGSHGCEASHSVRRKSLFSEMLTFGHKIPGRVVTQTFLGHFPWHRFGNQNALVAVAGRAISLKTLAGKRSGGLYMYDIYIYTYTCVYIYVYMCRLALRRCFGHAVGTCGAAAAATGGRQAGLCGHRLARRSVGLELELN